MMYRFTSSFFLVCFLFPVVMGQTQGFLDDQQDMVWKSVHKQLYDDIFDTRDYDNHVRPVKELSTQVNITMKLVLTDITAVDEMDHQVEINVWAQLNWIDELLQWNPNDFGGMDILVLPAEEIWLPDIVLYNSVGMEERFYEHAGKLTVYPDGFVHWSKKTALRFDCNMVMTSFPFDKQDCYLRFGSWSYDTRLLTLDIVEGVEPFDTKSEFHKNEEWAITNVGAYRKDEEYLSANFSTTTWAEVYFTMSIKRKYSFYLVTLLLPYFLISQLSGLVFVIQPETGEKMGLATTTLLALVVFNEYVMEIVPPSADYFPLLADYFVIMIFWVGGSVVISAWVLHIYHRDPKTCRWMKPWERYVVFRIMAGVIFEKVNTGLLSSQDNSMEIGEKSQGNVGDKLPMGQVNSSELIDDGNGMGSNVDRIRRLLESEQEEKRVDLVMKEVEEAPLEEWREAARIIDRFFFWAYTFTNVFFMLFFTLKSVFN